MSDETSPNAGWTSGTASPSPEASEAEPGFKVFDRRHWVDDDGDGEPSARAEVPSYVARLETQLKEKDEQLRQYIAAYKKEVVEGLEQAKQRLQREAEQNLSKVRAALVAPMLEVFEALERAQQSAQGGGDKAALLAGVERVAQLMVARLQELGVTRVPSVGERFDPACHEAVAVRPVDDPALDKTVVAEFSPGFSCDGKIFRPAKVQVGQLQS